MQYPSEVNPALVLELINTSTHIVEWSPRVVAKKLRLRYNPQNQRRIKRILSNLWKAGKIQRKAALRNNHQVIFCSLSVPLAESTVPCENCAFPVYMRNGKLHSCIRCSGGTVGDGDPSKIYLTSNRKPPYK